MSVVTTVNQEQPGRRGYARQRLLLGVSAVGSMVVLSVALLVSGTPRLLTQALPDWAAIAVFFGVVAMLHAAFDLLGGYLLPRRAGRRHETLGVFAIRWARGVVPHTLILIAIGMLMLIATAALGRVGFVGVTLVMVFVLLWLRLPLAMLIGTIRPERGRAIEGHRLAHANDEGFTGGITGVVRPGTSFLPAHWLERLPEGTFEAVARRRALAVASGGWHRGRLVALAFTAIGGIAAASAVPASSVGTGAGVIAYSLLFTIWSFAGLLVLPSLARAAATRLDSAARRAGVSSDDLEAAAGALDRLQDDEPQRAPWIERIFHPIPSVRSRAAALRDDAAPTTGPAAWDVARTAIFLSWSGLSLLSRSVHCNCGRPDLWVFLPIE